jgi:hypothetical protein
MTAVPDAGILPSYLEAQMFKIALYRHSRNNDIRLYVSAERAFPANLIKADWSRVLTFPPDGDHPFRSGIRERIVATGYAKLEARIDAF